MSRGAALRGWGPAALRARWRAAWAARQPACERLLLGQRNVYILPTRAGLMFLATLGLLLLASVNEQLSLGYALTFLLAGSGLVSMHLTHASLRGLALHLHPPAPGHAGRPIPLRVVLDPQDGRPRHGLGLRLAGEPGPPAWIDLPGGAPGEISLAWTPPRRGRHALPRIVLETRFPLGLFRAWAPWQPAGSLLAWPAVERDAPPPPPAGAQVEAGDRSRPPPPRAGGPTPTEPTGLRPWRRGDPARSVVWRKSAAALAGHGDPLVRETLAAAGGEDWLDWADTAGAGPAEARLSRLCAWLLAAEQRGRPWGLRLPGQTLPPDSGEAHRRQALDRLALW